MLYLTGCPLIAIYLAINRYYFQTWMPVSGQAKQLRWHHWMSLNAIESFFLPLTMRIHLELSVPGIVLAVGAILLLARGARLRPRSRFMYYALAVFPFIYLILLSCLTDWPNGIWPWYCYIFILPIVSFLAVVDTPRPSRFPYTSTALLLLMNVAIGTKLYTQVPTEPSLSRGNQGSYGTYAAGRWIGRFSSTHPGIYAMGDKAGAAGYFVRGPLVQLEGLMMDAQYLNVLRSQRDLNYVLQLYDVRYYVATNPKLRDGCYVVIEPAQAGSDSPKMTGRFCEAPVGSFTYSAPEVAPEVYRFFVFDLKPSFIPPTGLRAEIR
jgi:hypothetical protein